MHSALNVQRLEANRNTNTHSLTHTHKHSHTKPSCDVNNATTTTTINYYYRHTPPQNSENIVKEKITLMKSNPRKLQLFCFQSPHVTFPFDV